MAKTEIEEAAHSLEPQQQDTKPEADTTFSLPSPPPKRKQSPESDHDMGNKKRRLSAGAAHTVAAESSPLAENTQGNGYTDTLPPSAGGPSKSSSPVARAGPETSRPAASSSPAEPSSSNKPQIDERKRGKRLFGAVFGALGQATPNQLAKRREIERKQREKLRAQAEEDDAAREGRLAKLRQARMQEQIKYDRQGMRVRQSNRLAMAHSLFTTVEPRIYWKPWELTAVEEERIRRQVRDAEEEIEKERARDVAESKEGTGRQIRQRPDADREDRSPDQDEDERQIEAADAAMGGTDGAREKSWDEQNIVEDPRKSNLLAMETKEVDLSTQSSSFDDGNEANIRKDDIDEGAEDVNGEDTVIY